MPKDKIGLPEVTPKELLVAHLKPYRGTLALGVGAMLLEMLATLATPWMAGAFTRALAGGQITLTPDATPLLWLWAGLLLVQFGARAVSGYLLSMTSARVLVDLSRRVHDHLQFLPLAFHHQRRSGELLALLSHDVTQLSHFIAGPLAGVLPMLILLFGSTVMILLIDPVFGLAVLLLAPLLIVLVKLLGRQAQPLAVAAAREQARSLAVANETLGMLRLVKAHVLEQARQRAYQEQTDNVLALRRQQLWLNATVTPVVYLVASLVLLVLLWWAGQRLAAGQLSAPDLVSICLYGLLLIRPISGLGGTYLQLEQARGAAARIIEVLQQQAEPVHDGGITLAPLHGQIEFRDLSFGYPGRPRVLDHLGLTIRKGETVALTGANGAGKTTLAHLLMRFVEPDGGTILFDGTDIAKADLRSLRRQIGYVPQEVLISNGSVRDNIAFGQVDVDLPQVVAAAQAAGAHDFVTSLPDGYETQVGDQGMRLSGGQRQRLALARALLLEPAILVLDEPTSQIDRDGEAQFITAARKALQGRTVILITHQPRMLALATRVYRLEDGRLEEQPGAIDGQLPHSG